MRKIITASIVIFKEDFALLSKAVQSVLGSDMVDTLFIIDNSPNKTKGFTKNQKIEYLYLGKNIGFGSGHNTILERIKNKSDFHLILNPDAYFDSQILGELVFQLQQNKTLALISPKVLFPDGSFQNSCRRYPTILELFLRRFPLFKNLSKSVINRGIYKDKNLEEPFEAEYLTGCFHLYKTEDLIAIKGFDERYFLYMEDVDICRKIDVIGKQKLYYPKVYIHHVLKKESSKKWKLFIRHTISVIKYFIKWSFFFRKKN